MANRRGPSHAGPASASALSSVGSPAAAASGSTGPTSATCPEDVRSALADAKARIDLGEYGSAAVHDQLVDGDIEDVPSVMTSFRGDQGRAD
jgi:hypothetical protein